MHNFRLMPENYAQSYHFTKASETWETLAGSAIYLLELIIQYVGKELIVLILFLLFSFRLDASTAILLESALELIS